MAIRAQAQASRRPPPTYSRLKMDTSTLLTRAEAAARARISVRTLQKLYRQGRGPVFTRIGGQIFFAEQDVTFWLQSLRESRAGRPGMAA
jgi:hypothetical protein